MNRKNKNRKGFTLIELLVVIAIIAVLAVVVILSLNPAELLRQARDSNRINDMATLKSAISIYLADVASPFIGTSTQCYAGLALATSTSPSVPNSAGTWAAVATSTCGSWFATAAVGGPGITTSTSRGVGTSTAFISGNGWIPVNFTNISSGAPIGIEPIDPVNQAGSCAGFAPSNLSSCGLFYSYIVQGTSFKLGAFMESQKYATGTAGVEANDGGINNYVYEQGTNLNL